MEGSVENSPFFRQRKLEGGIIVREPPRIDIETYTSNYEGRTRLERLSTIACTSTVLALPAIAVATSEAKSGKDVRLYMDMVNLFEQIAPGDPRAVPDTEWVDMKAKQVKQNMERLESELTQYKNNMIKESIRLHSMELGDHYYDTGDFPNATKSYNRARDYCTTPKQVTEISLRLIKTGIAQHNWISVNGQVNKILTSTLKSEDKATLRPTLNAVQGLAQLRMGQYEDAARSFLHTPAAYATSPLPKDQTAGILFQKEIMTAHDLAVYGTLTALATLKRADLQNLALDSNKSFRSFLELEPQMRKAISLFVNGKYAACLEILARHRADWLCDPYLQQHVEILIRRVRQECVVLFFQPFSCVTLDEMAQTFGGKGGMAEQSGDQVVDIEAELVDMIQRRVLNARIDLVKRLLLAPTREPRQAVLEDTLEMAKRYEHELRLRLMRTGMLQAGLVLKPQGKQLPSQEAMLAAYGGSFPDASYSPGEDGSYGGSGMTSGKF